MILQIFLHFIAFASCADKGPTKADQLHTDALNRLQNAYQQDKRYFFTTLLTENSHIAVLDQSPNFKDTLFILCALQQKYGFFNTDLLKFYINTHHEPNMYLLKHLARNFKIDEIVSFFGTAEFMRAHKNLRNLMINLLTNYKDEDIFVTFTSLMNFLMGCTNTSFKSIDQCMSSHCGYPKPSSETLLNYGECLMLSSWFVSKIGDCLASFFEGPLNRSVVCRNSIIRGTVESCYQHEQIFSDTQMKENSMVFRYIPKMFTVAQMKTIIAHSQQPEVVRYVMMMKYHSSPSKLTVTQKASHSKLTVTQKADEYAIQEFSELIPDGGNFDKIALFYIYLEIIKLNPCVMLVTQEGLAPPKKILDLLPDDLVVSITSLMVIAEWLTGPVTGNAPESVKKIMARSKMHLSLCIHLDMKGHEDQSDSESVLVHICSRNPKAFFSLFISRLNRIHPDESIYTFDLLYRKANDKSEFLQFFSSAAREGGFKGTECPLFTDHFFARYLTTSMALLYLNDPRTVLSDCFPQMILNHIASQYI